MLWGMRNVGCLLLALTRCEHHQTIHTQLYFALQHLKIINRICSKNKQKPWNKTLEWKKTQQKVELSDGNTFSKAETGLRLPANEPGHFSAASSHEIDKLRGVGCNGSVGDTTFQLLHIWFQQTWLLKCWENKMKPTNPNADTYVEKRKSNTYLSQFPANPLVEHPDLTHWGDTLVGHPCLTLLRYALVRHSCLTLWFDTLAWHSSKTLLHDTLVRHFLLDTLTRHSCKTLLLDTLVEHFLLDTSYLALLTWHSSGTLLPDTLVRHSCLTDTLLQHSYLTLLYDTLTWHFLLDTLVRHSCKTLLWELL